MTRQRDDSNRPRRGAGGKPHSGSGKPRVSGGKPRANDSKPRRDKANDAPRKSFRPKASEGRSFEARNGGPRRDAAASEVPRKSFRPKSSIEDRKSSPRRGDDASRKFSSAKPEARRPKSSNPVASGQKPARPAERNVEHGEEARIAKVMARAGLCSRRDAEAWIASGRVSVNGVTLTSPALNVRPDDRILVDGVPLKPRERTRLFAFHKPRGLVTTDRDPEGRPTIFTALPEDLPRLVTVGRLDINTEGLLLLTNDGGLARLLELPSTGWLRRYRVRANGSTDQAALDRLRDGITIEGIEYQSIEATLDRVQGANVWLTMGLREGKNREVKRVLEHLGLTVNRLIRVSFGPFQLGEIEEGKVEEIRTRIIQDQLGPELARQAGLDFDAPIATAEERQVPERPRVGERPRAREEGRLPRDGARQARPEVRAGVRGRRAEPGPVEELRPRPVRPQPGPRKHISILRAEQRAETRKRTERAETSDRKGRKVTVERITPAAPRVAEPNQPRSRNAKRFAADRSAAGDATRPKRFGEHKSSLKKSDGTAFGERTARPGVKPRFEKGPGRDRPAGGAARPKRPGGSRPPRRP